MKCVCIGGGPAGLFLSILLKKSDPSRDVIVVERHSPESTFGWGVVFSDGTMDDLRVADQEVYEAIVSDLAHWDDIEIHFRGERIRSSGHGFCGIARRRLLEILHSRARSLGVTLRFRSDVEDVASIKDASLIVACDGVFSRTRQKYAEAFLPELDTRRCKYTWLGTTKKFEAFTFSFKETSHGWFQSHSYPFSDELSTFIVECHEDTWRRAGLDAMSKEDSVRFCEALFSDLLDGHPLLSNADHLIGSAAWINFVRVHCQRWHHQNIVLLGDASATAHFSIGSGTRLALKGAITLAAAIDSESTIEEALSLYESRHRLEVVRLQSAARNSMEWFENVAQKARLAPQQFAYSLLTRSQRISHENLRARDARYLKSMEEWYAASQGTCDGSSTPPMFVPFHIRDLHIMNRIAVSPMATYSAIDGMPNDFHLVHLGSRALGGAGLLFTEMTCVSPHARISPGCVGIYSPEAVAAWRRIVGFVHESSPSKICLQLGHAGPKGSTQRGWEEMDAPLVRGNWPIYAPSAIPYGPQNQIPIELTDRDLEEILQDFVAATHRAHEAGFDMIELHAAHGYLLSSFISPITNQRSDCYGGSLENRLRFPLTVFGAMRSVWPEEKPMSVRISAVDWVEGGTTREDSVAIALAFKNADADLIDVSTGQVSRTQKPVYGRMFQVPYAENIRLAVGIATMAVGNIYEPDHVNSILSAGRADLCLLARPHLWNPHWTMHAAARLGYSKHPWPRQYLSGKQQLEALIGRGVV